MSLCRLLMRRRKLLVVQGHGVAAIDPLHVDIGAHTYCCGALEKALAGRGLSVAICSAARVTSAVVTERRRAMCGSLR